MVKQSHPDEMIADVLKAKNPVDIHGLLARVIAEFGGNAGLAEKLAVLYEELPKNSPSRERILSNIMRLVNTVSDHQGPPLPAEEEELAAVLRQALTQEAE